MKSYEQRTREILEARDRILSERRRRRKIAEKCIAGTCGVCAVFFVCLNIFNKPELMNPVPTDHIHNTTVTASTEIPTDTPPATAPQFSQTTAAITNIVTAEIKTQATAASAIAIPEKTTVTALTAAENADEPRSTDASECPDATEPAKTTAVRSTTFKNVPTTASPTSQRTLPTTAKVTSQIEKTTTAEPLRPSPPPAATTAPPQDTPPDPVNPEPAEPPWDQKPFDKKYFYADIGNDVRYITAYMTVPAERIWEYIGMGTVSGQDNNFETQTEEVDVFLIDGYSEDEIIAVLANDGSGYYMYYNWKIDTHRWSEIFREFYKNLSSQGLRTSFRQILLNTSSKNLAGRQPACGFFPRLQQNCARKSAHTPYEDRF